METANININDLFEKEQRFFELVDSWQKSVMNDSDYGHIECTLDNSVYAEKCYEWAHYGYSRNEHRYIQERFDLNFNNAILVKYTVRQLSYEYGPSSDIHLFLETALCGKGYRCLGTTSDDEYGTHLTYWYLWEICEPADNPDYDPDEYEEEPYNRWDDPYYDEEY